MKPPSTSHDTRQNGGDLGLTTSICKERYESYLPASARSQCAQSSALIVITIFPTISLLRRTLPTTTLGVMEAGELLDCEMALSSLHSLLL
ncbi:hypothetical protein I7I48_10682 [Histoplasma ohiense]|nr:hypothetical protein I7I48_10682 [Histoplasma ohiense (nom. inval.)]